MMVTKMVMEDSINLDDSAMLIPRTSVYLITDGQYVKIGKTSGNPIVRLKALQTGNPRPLRLLAVCMNPTLDAFVIERYLHEEFKQYHVNGEWYDLAVVNCIIGGSVPHKLNRYTLASHFREYWWTGQGFQFNVLISKRVEINSKGMVIK